MNKYIELVLIYLKLIFKCKLIFKNPYNHDIVIFDNVGFVEIKKILSKYNHHVIETRLENLNKLYVSIKIIFLTIYFYRGNFFSSYIMSLITICNPRIVFTFIDNSYKFSEIARRFKKNKKIKFIALQNGARHEILENDYLYKKGSSQINNNNKFYIPTFLSFGNYEKKLYKKSKIDTGKIYPVGHLKLETYINYKKENKIILKKKKQICLISDHGAWNNNINILDKAFKKNYFKIFNFTMNYAIKKKIKIIICAHRLNPKLKNDNSSSYYFEKQDFSKYIEKKYKKFFNKNLIIRKNNRFNTYKLMDESEIVVATMSTMLRENLSLKNKIFACNTTKNKIYNFPLNNFFSMETSSYKNFEKKMNYLFKISKKNFFRKASRSVYDSQNKDQSTCKSTQLIFDNFLKN